ncbi:CDP-glycerol glycerophosphotransferase family protein [Isoptericola sp. NPDC019482]|uniref:CDP-glycerol glycerophosphotransferase family protein n=1 Tax=Isoptericola sp. NPDC019482 TaxID=3154688 RepID=UPI003485E94D
MRRDGGDLVFEGDYWRRGWTVVGVRADESGGGSSLRFDADVDGAGYRVVVDVRKVLESGHEDTVHELWIEVARPRAGLSPSRETYSFAEVFEVQSVRLGKYLETERAEEELWFEAGGRRGVVDISTYGNVNLVVGGAEASAIKFSGTDLNIRDNTSFRMRTKVVSGSALPAAVELVVRGRQTQTEYTVPVERRFDAAATRATQGRLTYDVRGEVDLAAIPAVADLGEDTIDFLVRFTSPSGRSWERRLPDPGRARRSSLASVSVEVDGLTHLLVPYVTFRQSNLSMRLERFRPGDYDYLRRLQRVAWTFPVARLFTDVWLVGEVPYKAQDNGYRFFEHVRKEHPRKRAYYVIDRDSPDYEKVAALGNVVPRFSREHIRYTLLASRFVGSHHAEYLYASRDVKFVRWVRGVRIFLQHGPTATKNVVPNYGRQGTVERPTEKFLVTSDLEKQIVVEDYGYRPRQVEVTGFARFDRLLDGEATPERALLIMPTWRDTLQGEDAFLGSDYFREWSGLVGSPELHRMLEAEGMTITFVLHPNMRKYADHFAFPGVRVVRPGERDVQDLLKSHTALVTDFSSVAWDFSYLRKPVVYFQFDQASLVGARSPHVDVATDVPGKVVTTITDAVEELGAIANRGFTVEEHYAARSRDFLKYEDTENCARIYRTVQHAWSVGTAFERVRNLWLAQAFWRRYRKSRYYFPTMKLVNRVGRLLPRTNVVLFECDRGTHYSDSPRYIYEELARRHPDLDLVWALNTTDRVRGPRTRKVRRHSPTYWWIASRARYWVSNQNMPADLVPSRRTRYLQTWHGTPLKKMQHDVPNMAGRSDDYEKRAARLTSYWSTLISPSPYATRAFQSAFRFEGEMLEQGYPRNDILASDRAAEARSLVRLRLGIPADKKIVLYAPTFRDDMRNGVHWQHDLGLDIERLEREIGERAVLLVRFHPLVRTALPDSSTASGFARDAAKYPDIQELLAATDVLITDYSSVFFDYAITGRPMVFFAYDIDHYRDDLRGFYLDYEKSVPGPIVTTNEALSAAVAKSLDRTDGHEVHVQAFRREYAPHDDGYASQRVVDAFFR